MSGLGWNPEMEAMHDKAMRAVDVPLSVSAPSDVPATFDPSAWFLPENQGQFNSCCGNARAGLAEYLYWIQTQGTVIQLSRRFAYITAKMLDKTTGSDNGATISGGILGSKQYGEALESVAPYWKPGERYSPALPQESFGDAESRKLKSATQVRSYDDCDRVIASGSGGLLLGIYWSAALAGNRTGLIDKWPGENGGGHALWLGGWQTRGGERWFGIWNSHGAGWGDKGHAWVAPAVLDRWCKSSPFKVIGASDLTVPHKRPMTFQDVNWT